MGREPLYVQARHKIKFTHGPPPAFPRQPLPEPAWHARAASRFVHEAGAFRSRVRLGRDGVEVDGKSILGLLSLAAVQGATLRLTCDGDDEERAALALEALVENRFGEES